jgi:hypothetical protein
MLPVFRWRARLDNRAAQPSREPDALAINISTGVFQEFERLRKVPKLNADLLEHGIRIVLDELEAGLVENLDMRDITIDPGGC